MSCSKWVIAIFHVICRQEVEPAKALLRSECYYQTAPKANASSAAAHLINYGLHCITDRLKSSSDLRMSSLKSVNNLVSLQAGDKSQFKWGSRQPVRRRRGDVHRDLTVVAIRLHWDGALLVLQYCLTNTCIQDANE